jgi:hypothetical protein
VIDGASHLFEGKTHEVGRSRSCSPISDGMTIRDVVIVSRAHADRQGAEGRA